jgi:hypothetical protein
MDLQNFLTEALKERFKANVIVENIENEIKSIAEFKTFEKYKDKKLFNDGMEFELIGVRAICYIYRLKISKVELNLAYLCISKLPKNKRLKMEQQKIKYEKERFFDWCYYKIPLWKILTYSIELENILSGNINLLIE